ncbi:MAG: hypothetical protein IVW54_07160, partial [Candidatus Binataceae bacterium]|nr:hypothetical protein [Candidatus Binataceae bacterium]
MRDNNARSLRRLRIWISAIVVMVFTYGQAAAAVTITSPVKQAAVSGTVPIVATMSGKVTTIKFFVDGKYMTSTSSDSYNWDSTEVPNGLHMIGVRGFSAREKLIARSAVSIRVNNPVVTITSPLAKSTVVDTVSVTTQVQSPSIEARFFVDGHRVTPSSSLTYTWDTTNMANGYHTLAAKGFKSGQLMGRNAVRVLVKNIKPIPKASPTVQPTPTATITQPTPTATATVNPTPTATPTAKPTPTPTLTATATAKPTPT